jgi:hypothetical protein
MSVARSPSETDTLNSVKAERGALQKYLWNVSAAKREYVMTIGFRLGSSLRPFLSVGILGSEVTQRAASICHLHQSLFKTNFG